ncbi:D-alanyl-D-alanine carboxypeptidase family protein [Leifsonia poae]|uniref:D-alanyl-D-alanine carboxypeptidase family protein n=1 Tax=Leifsonia poae TaxID=110933 RepID=UPI001CBB601F|nr:D-alanyl-D-alanine carboxypeptidase [Leifsonia poae]
MHDQPRRLARRNVYRRRRIVVFGLLGVVLVSVLYVAGSLFAPVPATAAVTSHQATIAQPAAKLAWPGSGSSGITAPAYSGATAFHGSAASVPIASITKTITALVVLDKKPLTAGSDGPTIRFTQKDVDIWNEVIAEGGSWAPVVAGTSMTEKQALEAMLLPSANNYAITLANWSYGSTGAFVKAANSWLTANKFTGTHMDSPDGLTPGSVSTPKDLLGIGKLVLADPVLSSIVSLKTVTLPGAGEQDNTNSLLGVDGIDGLKTGNTDEAGYCLLFSARVTVGDTKVRVVGVVLGAQSHDDLWASVKALLGSMKNGFHEVEASTIGQSYGTYTTPWGAKTTLVSTKAKSFVVWSDTPIQVAVQTRPLQAGAKGDVVGQVTFTLDGKTQTAPLALASELTDPGFLWRLAHPGGLGA